jgi:hypothetical protein
LAMKKVDAEAIEPEAESKNVLPGTRTGVARGRRHISKKS